jgi:hypothetical protein
MPRLRRPWPTIVSDLPGTRLGASHVGQHDGRAAAHDGSALAQDLTSSPE